jgi:hypothetical protein
MSTGLSLADGDRNHFVAHSLLRSRQATPAGGFQANHLPDATGHVPAGLYV